LTNEDWLKSEGLQQPTRLHVDLFPGCKCFSLWVAA